MSTILEDILKNKNIYLRGEALKLFVDNKFIIDVDMKKEEPLKVFIEKYSEYVPSDFDFQDKEERLIKKEDAINDDEILIEDILIENKINIVSKNVNKKNENKLNNIIINEEPDNNTQQKITINIYINNKAKTI